LIDIFFYDNIKAQSLSTRNLYMITKSDIDRINELARKKKAEGLTQEEIEEQKLLREKYLADFRKRFKAELENIEIVEPDDPCLLKNRRKH